MHMIKRIVLMNMMTGTLSSVVYCSMNVNKHLHVFNLRYLELFKI